MSHEGNVKLVDDIKDRKVEMKDSGLYYGAKAFVNYVKEHTTGYEPTYQKFMDLVSEINYKMLGDFEDSIDDGDEREKEFEERENNKENK